MTMMPQILFIVEFFDFFIERFEFPAHIRQRFDKGVGPLGLVGVNGRSTENRRTIRNIIDHGGLCADGDPIADLNVSDNSNLSADDAMMADLDGPGDPRLRLRVESIQAARRCRDNLIL